MAKKAKKVIMFIVEGPTDEDALSPILKQIFQDKNIHFHVVHGDLTTAHDISAQGAIKTVYEHIEQEMDRYGYRKSDVIKIIHLIDTDGAFIPPDKVEPGCENRTQYLRDKILSSNPWAIRKRNQQKTEVVHRLRRTNIINKISYEILYFSRNLEHVLHNIDTDLTDEQKIFYADSFADCYIGNLDAFITFINSPDIAVKGAYSETWDYIMEGSNSLGRHCNLHLIFQEEILQN